MQFWLKAPTSAFTFKTLFTIKSRHYAKHKVDVKLGCQCKGHKGWAGWLALA